LKRLNKNAISFLGKGRKRLFLIFGFFNFLLTNISLQILLLIIPTLFATIISQIINFLFGFYLYGKKVFKVVNLNSVFFKRYLFLALILWLLNFGFIQSLYYLGLNKNFTALIMILPLVAISYLTQKFYVFK
tara:strand:+ start:5129 stop:5524 length:396 start_codon:yes stop_codon:yes gene_type:complete